MTGRRSTALPFFLAFVLLLAAAPATAQDIYSTMEDDGTGADKAKTGGIDDILADPAADPAATPADTEEAPAADEAPAEGQTAADKPEQPADMDPEVLAPTLMGAAGLIRVVSTDVGPQHSFTVGFHGQYFKSSGFLVNNDENSRFIGNVSVGYTPWRYLEIFAHLTSMSNENYRPPEQNRLDQELILALGDFGFGVKGQYPVLPYLGVGAYMDLTFLNSVGGNTPDGDSTTFAIALVSTFNLAPLANFPLRVHFNGGYILDNSDNLTEGQFTNYSLASLQVEKFALGINRKRLAFKVGIDVPLRRYIKLFGLTPMIEFHADVATGETDDDFDNTRFQQLRDQDLIDGRSTIAMSFALRANPISGLGVDFGADVGISSPGYGHGPPVVPWNLVFGLTYAYDTKPRVKVIKAEPLPPKTIVKTVAPKVGKLRGRVVNATTLEPIEGAVVTFPGKDLTGLYTDPDGSFLSYQLTPGKHAVMIRKEGFKPAKMMIDVQANEVTTTEVKLEPEAPKVGRVGGKIVDLNGKPVAATLLFTGPDTKKAQAAGNGIFSAELKPGSYTVDISARGHLRKRTETTIVAGQPNQIAVTLSPKPRRRLVKITKNGIAKLKPIKFAKASATILPESRQLLDAIVDGLLSTPSLKLIEIQGHTDNRGSLDKNMQLSQARAEAVMSYLVQNGVSSRRLQAKGYGPTRPKRPNITARNRRMNRRVDFVVLESE